MHKIFEFSGQSASLLTILIISFVCHLSAFGQQSLKIAHKPEDISPLLDGEQIPDILLENMAKKPIQLQTLVAKQPTVLIFYRGGWCPYCNAHLAELQEIEPEILKLGYQIIAISPDSPDYLEASVDKHHLNYQLLSDGEMKGAIAFGIAYHAPENNQKIIFKYSDGSNPGLLPVPSVFVVDKKGMILFEYINPDYRTRIKGNVLLAVLRSLNE